MLKKIPLTFICLFLLVAYSTLWFVGKQKMEEYVSEACDKSNTISCGNITVSGFPFLLKTKINNLNYQQPFYLKDKKEYVVNFSVEELELHTNPLLKSFKLFTPRGYKITLNQNTINFAQLNAKEKEGYTKLTLVNSLLFSSYSNLKFDNAANIQSSLNKLIKEINIEGKNVDFELLILNKDILNINYGKTSYQLVNNNVNGLESKFQSKHQCKDVTLKRPLVKQLNSSSAYLEDFKIHKSKAANEFVISKLPQDLNDITKDFTLKITNLGSYYSDDVINFDSKEGEIALIFKDSALDTKLNTDMSYRIKGSYFKNINIMILNVIETHYLNTTKDINVYTDSFKKFKLTPSFLKDKHPILYKKYTELLEKQRLMADLYARFKENPIRTKTLEGNFKLNFDLGLSKTQDIHFNLGLRNKYNPDGEIDLSFKAEKHLSEIKNFLEPNTYPNNPKFQIKLKYKNFEPLLNWIMNISLHKQFTTPGVTEVKKAELRKSFLNKFFKNLKNPKIIKYENGDLFIDFKGDEYLPKNWTDN